MLRFTAKRLGPALAQPFRISMPNVKKIGTLPRL
jgi:hypothetical protein